MARIDPAPAFRGYQEEVWQLMRGGASFDGMEDAIDQTDVDPEQKLALWLLAFSLSDPEQPHYGYEAPDDPPASAVVGRHLSVVG